MKKNTVYRASMTVEAAFVVPMVLAVIFLLISLDFYVHERAWHTLAACEAALTGENAGRLSAQQGENETTNTLCQLLKADPLPMAETEVQVQYGQDQIRAGVTGRMAPVSWPGDWQYTAEADLKRLRPAQLLRKVRAAGSLLDSIGELLPGKGGNGADAD